MIMVHLVIDKKTCLSEKMSPFGMECRKCMGCICFVVNVEQQLMKEWLGDILDGRFEKVEENVAAMSGMWCRGHKVQIVSNKNVVEEKFKEGESQFSTEKRNVQDVTAAAQIS